MPEMPSHAMSRCKQCNQPMVEIDHWGERLTGCPRVVQRAIAGNQRLANGAVSRLTTSWHYATSKPQRPKPRELPQRRRGLVQGLVYSVPCVLVGITQSEGIGKCEG
jgi:hypothetical protein